jgi:acrylyl-CoA reductase (NADPH)
VRLIGVDSGYTPMPLRRKVWDRLASDLKPRHLGAIATTIGFADLPVQFDQMLKGGARGRAVVDVWH